MKILPLIALVFLLSGCSSATYGPHSLVTSTLVSVENACEDPVIDAQTYTLTEGLADVFLMPLNLVILAGRLGATFTVVPVLSVMGMQPEAIVSRVNWVLPIARTGPDPARVRYLGINPEYQPCARMAKNDGEPSHLSRRPARDSDH